MTNDSTKAEQRKQKAKHEAQELLLIFVYLAFFFCSLAAYSRLLLNDTQVGYFTYGFALLNALIIAKVILIGQLMHLGTKYESRPLLVSVMWKAFLFGVLVLAFHFVEEIVKGLLHHKDLATVFAEVRFDELLARTVIIFLTFISLFAFMEFRRVLGEERFYAMLFHSEAAGR